MSKNLRRTAVLGGVAASLLAAFGPLSAQIPPPLPKSDRAAPPAAGPLKIGFVHVSPVGEAGWTYQHELGRLALERALGARVQTRAVENVPEGPDAERVIRDLAAQGHRLIFTTSFGYMDPTIRVAGEFPQVAFEHMGGYKTAPNVGTYNARFYEGRYLAGLVAGRMSRSGTVGYVAGFPLPEVLQGINAFAIGLRESNPRAQVKVLWLNAWFDPPRERDAALSLVNQGADVITHHSATSAAVQAAEERGAMSIAYHSDMARLAPRGQLTAVTHHWDAHYRRVAEAVLAGRWKPQPVWGGIRDGFIALAPLHARVPAEVAARVREREREIAAGRFHPFSGRLADNQGRVRQTGGTMDDAALAGMDFLLEGVVGTLPK